MRVKDVASVGPTSSLVRSIPDPSAAVSNEMVGVTVLSTSSSNAEVTTNCCDVVALNRLTSLALVSVMTVGFLVSTSKFLAILSDESTS